MVKDADADNEEMYSDTHPLTTLLGDNMAIRTLNVLIKTQGRRHVRLPELFERVEATSEEEIDSVVRMLNRLNRIGALSCSIPNTVRFNMGHDAMKPLVIAEEMTFAMTNPDSYVAHVLQEEGHTF